MNHLDLTQVEQLKEIGTHLSQIRQEQDIPLEEIAARTYIPLRLLRAIEAGRADLLPEPVFVQGFIRRYADYLGLDGTAFSKAFPASSPVPVAPTIIPPEFEADDPPSVASSTHPSKSYLPYALAGLVGAGVLIYVFSQLKPTETSPRQSAPVTASNTTKPEPPAAKQSAQVATSAAQPLPSPSQTVPPQPSASASAETPIEVGVNLTERSWLQVEADGKVEFEGVLEKGEQKTWKAKQQLVLQAGNAGGVEVSLNQGDAKVLGKAGDVKTVTFTPKTAQPKPVN